MNPTSFAGRAVVVASTLFLTTTVFAACELRSGPTTAALVELFTSEGCSSCPPADRLLGQLRESLDPGAQAVALALHVGYWDYIGWKDPFAQAVFDERQTWLVHANGQRTLYTPQFFVGGTELRSTHASLRDAVRRLNATPAAASIRVRARFAPTGALTVQAEAAAQPSGAALVLYVAVAESGLVSNVARGENAGVRLEHDHVARTWIGPIRLGADGASLRRELALPADWKRANLELAAFVQDERNGRVLQAVGGSCKAP